jgi:hypothetical protein
MVVENGIIKAIGPRDKVEIPKGAIHKSLGSHVVTPGFVHPASVDWARGGRLNFSGSGNAADKSVTQSMQPTKALVEQMLKSGYTTVAAIPSSGVSGGTGALLQLIPKPEDDPTPQELLLKDAAVLQMAFQPGTQSKAAFEKVLTTARTYIKERDAFAASAKKKPEASSTPEKKPESKPEEKPAPEAGKPEGKVEAKQEDPKKEEPKKEEPKKEEGPKEPKKDPKIEPFVDLLEGRLPGILALADAASFLHFSPLFETEASFRPTLMMVPTGFRSMRDAWRVVDEIKKLNLSVILDLDIDTVPRSSTRRVTQRILLDHGVPVALIPSNLQGDAGLTSSQKSRRFHIELLEMIRHGVSVSDVLRCLTETPAQMLGLGESHGTLSVGKRADFLVFDGEPFAPRTSIVKVAVAGVMIYESENQP